MSTTLELLEDYREIIGPVDLEPIVGKLANMVLRVDDDIALLIEEYKGAYVGHFFFKSRGRQAVSRAKEFLAIAFDKAEVIIGLTPKQNRAACWMSRHIGFTSHGSVFPVYGECELFILTKDEYERNKHG